MSSLILKLAFGRNFNASSRLVKENKNLRDDVMSSKLAHTVRIERWKMSAPYKKSLASADNEAKYFDGAHSFRIK